LAEEESVPGIH